MPNTLNNKLWFEHSKLVPKRQFVDNLWWMFCIVVLIGVPLSLARIPQTGWMPVYGFHLVLGVAVLLVYWFRAKLHLTLKTIMAIGLMILLGVSGLLNFGLAAAGAWWLALAVLLAALLLSRLWFWSLAIFCLALLVSIGTAFSLRWLTLSVNLNEYMQTPIAWFGFVLTNLLLVVILARAIITWQQMMQMETQFQFRQWIEDLPLALEVLDHNKKLYYQNAAARQLIGAMQASGALQQQVFFECAPQRPKVATTDLPSYKALQGESMQFREMCLEVQGKVVVLRSWGWPGFLESGAIGFGIAVFEDISEQKQLEMLKNNFVATVSHELRTPLTAIRGAIGLLASGTVGTLPTSAVQMVNICQQNSDKLLFIVNDLLDLQKMERGKLELSKQQVVIASVLEKSVATLSSYAQEHQINLLLQIPEECSQHQALLDPMRLGQVMTNLISNAVKFSHSNQDVRVRLDCLNQQLFIYVEDDGEGIPLEFQQRIFEPFSQADGSNTKQRNGTGLGLSISKTLVEQMQGEISFTSAPNKGTKFCLRFPRSEGANDADQLAIADTITQ